MRDSRMHWGEMLIVIFQGVFTVVLVSLAIYSLISTIGEYRNATRRTMESHEIERASVEDELVQGYRSHIQELLELHGLQTSLEGSRVRRAARAHTLTVLDQVNGVRKATIVQFLYEARLLGYWRGATQVAGIVELTDANLSGVTLSRINLAGVNLSGALLAGADLHQSKLFGAEFRAAFLGGACLDTTDLQEVNFLGANLTGANVINADLIGADFTDADLTGADLSRCKGLTVDQLLKAASLHGTKLPNYINPADLDDK